MRKIALAAAAAALSTFADFGLSRSAPKIKKRGGVDISMPYIPPARIKATTEEKRAIRGRMRQAEEKRQRKAERLQHLVAAGGFA